MFNSAAKIGKPPMVPNQLEALVGELVARIHGIFASLGEAAKAYRPVMGPNGPTTDPKDDGRGTISQLLGQAREAAIASRVKIAAVPISEYGKHPKQRERLLSGLDGVVSGLAELDAGFVNLGSPAAAAHLKQALDRLKSSEEVVEGVSKTLGWE
jgi:hypothetical protein